MTTKLWERLRGYDKWIETTATFESAELRKIPYTGRSGQINYTYHSYDTITWADQKGETHRADVRVPDSFSRFLLVDGNKPRIRYNPADPDRFYYPDLLRSRIATILKRVGLTILILAVLSLVIGLSTWINSKH